MNIIEIIIYIIASFILTIILNILETKKKTSLFDYVIISNIYLLVLASLFKTYSENLFLVIICSSIINIFYTTYIKEIQVFTTYNITKYLLNIITSYLLNIYFINNLDNVLPTAKEIKPVIWLFIVGYLYLNIKDNKKITELNNKKELTYLNSEYITMQYAKFKTKYYKEIKPKEKELIPLIYAIMIYENYHKSKLRRKLDKFKLFNKNNKYGIMQVVSTKPIDDITSIKLSIKKLDNLFKENFNLKEIVTSYYGTTIPEIVLIYKEIINFDKK